MSWTEPRFRMARRGGYDVLEVDELIDDLEAFQRGGSSRTFTADQVRAAQFSVTRRSGYLEQDVDAWLDQVARSLETGSPSSSPMTGDPAAVRPSVPVSPALAATSVANLGSTSATTSGPPRWIVLIAVAALLVGIVLAVYALM